MGHKLNHAAVWFLLAMVLLQSWIFWSIRGKVLSGYADFTAFYGAGQTVGQGRGDRLYDPQEQWRVQQEFARDVAIRQGPLPYLRLPFEALLFLPLTFLSYSSAYLFWLLLNLGVVIAVALFLRRHLRPLQEFPVWLPLLMALGFTPVFLTLLQGQDTILLLLFYSLAYDALREGADFRAGCWLGLGLIKPHLVLPFVAIALLRGKYKVAGGFGLVAIILLVVSLGVAGGGLLHYPGYLRELEQHTERGLVQPRDNPNLRGLVEGFGSGLAPSAVLVGLVALLSLGLIAWVWVRATKTSSGKGADLIFCQAVIVSVLVSYHAFAYDLTLLLLPIFLLATEWSVRKAGSTSWLVFAPVAVLLCGPIFPLLWLRWHALSLIALVLLVWMWGIDRESDAPPKTLLAKTV